MAVEMILLNTFRFLEYRSVNDNILKCLNFLGNYSLTAGEITGVLGQVSKYMEEPLKGVLSVADITVQNLTKYYGDRLILKDISFDTAGNGGKGGTSEVQRTCQKSGDQYTLHGRSDNTGRQ